MANKKTAKIDDSEQKEIDRFVRFIKRLKEENLLGCVGIINVDPKTKNGCFQAQGNS